MISSGLRFGLGVVCISAVLQQSHTASVASSAIDCMYTSPSGKQIDLSPLKHTLGYTIPSAYYETYLFYVNVCGAIGYSDFKDPEKCPKGTTGSCEIQKDSAEKIASEAYGLSTSYTIVYQNETGGDIPAGAMLTYTTDAICPRNSKPWTTKIYFECNATAHEPIAKMIDDSYWECYAHVKIKTSLVCELYECDSTTEQCVEVAPGSGSGVSKEDCEKMCGGSESKYRCVDDRCVISTDGGVSKDECDSGCENSNYECEHNQCVQSDTGRFSRDECEKFCGPPSNFGVITEK